MRKEISPELYNYNKFPGPEFRQLGNQILTEKIQFELVENYRQAFDVTAFNQRFSEILTKFDYIVGDWGNEQLRLRGFYKDEKHKGSERNVSRLEDYLLEYCNYGCAYFVLENPHPQRASFDKKSHKSKNKQEGEGKSKRSKNQRQWNDDKRRFNKDKKRSRSQQNRQSKHKDNRHFVIRQK